ncbi:MAG: type II toxin-antitoxin system HicB family antitoxin [Desulfarculaceae bacterium]|nr:type II toxin-antitoxin system HicB family antitoxin [Desulfarculaceae bacterium]MCF8073606.1 type II toxin-antitoxin system HicB family antitoxin [Desulfarculaceae bacterium]MCF8103763.1 type II toxin-antitoxin system HicB family antitoxin [Desulfarculaceae bacterium]MCF8115678.1 type II toxin-antitoxin system HicB family antitoxin [Desulfarculaceae bacterium]
MAAKRDKLALLRALEDLADYPAMLLPGTGGWEVMFPNLAGLTAWGQSKEMARLNGEEALTFELGRIVAGGDTPPPPSDPERLIPDEEEPPGSELVMLSPDKAMLRARLGLGKKEKGNPLGATLGRLGRK